LKKKPKSEITKTKPINIMLQEDLISRINAFCAEQELTIHEFVTDAIIEKLALHINVCTIFGHGRSAKQW